MIWDLYGFETTFNNTSMISFMGENVKG